jgi:hypothetical protein
VTAEIGSGDRITGDRVTDLSLQVVASGPTEPPPPFTPVTRPWLGSSQKSGLTGFNRLQTQIVKRSLELRRVFSPTFPSDPVALVQADWDAGRVPVLSVKPPPDPDDWIDWGDTLAAPNKFVILTVNHEPENDVGATPEGFKDTFEEMYTRVSSHPQIWSGPIMQAVTATSAGRQGWRDMLDTIQMDILMVDGYNPLNRRSFSQIFNWFALKARSRTDLNTDPSIPGIPWGIPEFATHGTDDERVAWLQAAATYWTNPTNRDLVFGLWFDSDIGDNASYVGWFFEQALPPGWYPQTIEGKGTKLYARSKPEDWAAGIEWVADTKTPAKFNELMNTARRQLGPLLPPDPPPPVQPEFGALPLGQTAYPIPNTGVVYVAPTGSDSGTGAVGNPVATIQRAIDLMPQDGTVVVRAGEYAESLTGKWRTRGKIQAYPGEPVTLMGSDVVTGWTRPDPGLSQYRKTNWLPELDRTMDADVTSGAHPEAAWPDQIWVDDLPLQQVKTLAEVTNSAPDEPGAPGTFFHDLAANTLWIGASPFLKVVRVGRRQIGFSGAQEAAGSALASPRVDLLGLGFKHFVTSPKQYGCVRIHAPDTLVENCHVIGASSSGVFVNNAQGVKILRNTFKDCGQMSVRGYKSPFIEVAYNDVENSNRKLFDTAKAAGGFKIDTHCDGTQVHHNRLTNTRGHAIWLDLSDQYSSVSRNEVFEASSSGIFWEMSSVVQIVGNYLRDCNIGVLVSEAGYAELWNNTFVDNITDWKVQTGPRPNSTFLDIPPFPQTNFKGVNNLFSHSPANNDVRFMMFIDPHNLGHDIDDNVWSSNYSAGWFGTQGTAKVAELELNSGVLTTYASFSAMNTGTGHEANGIFTSGGTDPYLASNRRTAIGGAVASGTPIPDSVRDRLGWDTGQQVTPNRGAF